MKKTTKTAKTAAASKPATAPATETAAHEGAAPATRMQERRYILSHLSQELRKKATDKDATTNALLLDYYAAKHGSAVFDTFDGWKAKGRAVKRGERACAFWTPAADKGKSGWLMRFLFAETQTTERRAPEAGNAAPAIATA